MAISIADSSYSPRSSLGLLLDPEKVDPPRPKQSMWHRLGLRRWLGRDDRDSFSSRSPASTAASDCLPAASNYRSKRTNHNNHDDPSATPSRSNSPPPKPHDNLTRRLSRKVGVGLPRSTTFKRQNSERRDRLSPVDAESRRALSADRRSLSVQRTKSPQPVVDPRLSAPEVQWRDDPDETTVDDRPETNENNHDSDTRSEWNPYPEPVTDGPEEPPDDILEMELEKRWILNLSMHFRDRSEREKFFVTYAETPNRWRRVTISCDYRDAEPDSLEQDLKELRYQRDKCARVYESIRDSLPEIQFYDTVTNLKLETRDGRLHVHVTEDVNEIIPYPPVSCIGHLPDSRLVPESRLHFEAHLSGFVYNVRLDGKTFIKKEIPGPDTVDEFLYEINALHALHGTPSVIQVEGIVVDDQREVVKGLLINFAEKGALVDILYEHRGTISWERRERWARQIVQGLCEIHEAGYVQGDFTLSNIVVDANDDAKIIDINRRGCPVGWEPPEIAAKIESNQRISMYIGVKTDIFQLGMTLWALAMEEDEPERQRRPFVLDEDVPVPDYYRRMVSVCLSPVPRHRLSAKELLNFFPRETGSVDQSPRMQPTHASIGVGLHNGALPLYDARTSFLYPRGRPLASFSHGNVDLPRDELPPEPQDDCFSDRRSYSRGASPVAPIDREDQGRQTNSNEVEEPRSTQPNGILKNDQSFDEDRLVYGPIQLTASIKSEEVASPQDGQGSQNNIFPDYQQNEIHLETNIDPHHRDSSMEPASDLLSEEHLPDELTGVGGNPACSLKSRNDLTSELFVAECTADVLPVAELTGATINDCNCCGQEPSQPASSLLSSSLPINPAAKFLEQEMLYTTDNLPPLNVLSTSGYPQRDSQDHRIHSLNDSQLPINPAFTERLSPSV